MRRLPQTCICIFYLHLSYSRKLSTITAFPLSSHQHIIKWYPSPKGKPKGCPAQRGIRSAMGHIRVDGRSNTPLTLLLTLPPEWPAGGGKDGLGNPSDRDTDAIPRVGACQVEQPGLLQGRVPQPGGAASPGHPHAPTPSPGRTPRPADLYPYPFSRHPTPPDSGG